MTYKKSVLVVAAHPDDEILGCGGTMALHVLTGHRVHVLILGEGVTSRALIRDKGRSSAKLLKLMKAAHIANSIIGVKSLTFGGFPDNRLDSIDQLDLIKVVEDQIERVRPDIVYTHHVGDLNMDHRAIHRAVAVACRPMPEQCVKTLLFFEVPSSTEWQPRESALAFVPDWFTDISSVLDKKNAALKRYQVEMRSWPHPRSAQGLVHLARWRGASVGVRAAEAFMLGRRIVDNKRI